MKYPGLIIIMALLLSGTGNAAINTLEFTDKVQEERYTSLTNELRCLVCQNQSLADSDAELAQDLRKEVYKMLQQGMSDKEIINFLVARYGDFVLYSPPVKPSTIPLWIGPFILLLLGLGTLVIVIRRRPQGSGKELTEAEQQRLKQLLDANDKDDSA